MKLCLTALLIFFFTALSRSQNAKLDSLDRLISSATSDTARINLTNKKILIYNNVNIDTAIALSKRTIEKARSINYKLGEANARLSLSTNYCVKGFFDLAAENLSVSNTIFQSLKDSSGLCATYSNYGMLYGMKGKYDTSTQYLEKAIAIAERNNFTDKLTIYYGNIAIGYQMQANFPEALRYQQKSLDVAKAANNILSQAYTNLNMGLTYSSIGDTVRAKQFIYESLKLAKMQKLKNIELYAYSNLANLYSKKEEAQTSYELAMKAAVLGKEMGDNGIEAASLSKAADALARMEKFPEAEVLAKKANVIADSTGQALNIYQAYFVTGTILKEQQKYAEAIPYLEKSVAASDKTDQYNETVGTTYNALSLCYEKTGNFSKALSLYKLSSGIADSVRSRDNIRKTTELNMNYEFGKKQEAQRIEQKNKDAITHARQLALIIVFGLVSILAIVAFSAYRNKQKANAQLLQQKEEIQNTLTKLKETQGQLIQSEKMASLGELTAGIAHEIQNPLNFINNFSDLNAELMDELKEEIDKGNIKDAKLIADDIKENEQKINHHGKRADGIVKSMLQHSRQSKAQKEPTDVNTLVDEYIRLSYHGMRAKNNSFNATIQTHFDEHTGKANMVGQDVGRVLLNLFNNAFYSVAKKKQTLPAGYEPTVKVSTQRQNNNIIITVYDNGLGIPQSVLDKIYQPFFTTKPTGDGTGLGLSLSYDIITKAHNGTLKTRSEEGSFAEFIISLPVS